MEKICKNCRFAEEREIATGLWCERIKECIEVWVDNDYTSAALKVSEYFGCLNFEAKKKEKLCKYCKHINMDLRCERITEGLRDYLNTVGVHADFGCICFEEERDDNDKK